MFQNAQDGYLKANTILFSQNVSQAISDMVGIPYQICKETLTEAPFESKYRMVCYISFSGSIQGHYLCAVDDLVALKMIGAYEDGMTQEQLRDMRGDYSGFMKELLNLSVGQSIVELEKRFGDLTFSPSTVVYGEVEFPNFQSGCILIEGKPGMVQAGFSLNLANLKIGQKLEEALADLQTRTAQAKETQKNITCILESLPNGLLAIGNGGSILPGYSKSFQKIVGRDASSLVGESLADLLGLKEPVLQNWASWVDLVFEKYGQIPFKDLEELSDLLEIRTSDGRILKIDYYPVDDDSGTGLEKLLVMIEDISRQRELEQKMNEVNSRHQENIEMISQVINLNPDEVTDFIYDSSQLLDDARKIVEGKNLDREFVNELFRTFHTLKGSSGQFQFKSLQQMAHKVEGYLRTFRDDRCVPGDDAIEEIRNSIENATGYLTRIEDIKSKLGGRDEPLKAKARRDPETVMVNLVDLRTLKGELVSTMKKERAIAIAPELDKIHLMVDNLSKMKLSFFHSSFKSLVKNTCEKIGKKASVTVGTDIAIDVEVVRKVHQCLLHMINNALDHGIETPEERMACGKRESGLIVLSGREVEGEIEILLEDDGAGVDFFKVKGLLREKFAMSKEDIDKLTDEELCRYLCEPGFTTKSEVSEISGRGVGMDFVHVTVQKLGGRVLMSTETGSGTKVALRIPQRITVLEAEVSDV